MSPFGTKKNFGITDSLLDAVRGVVSGETLEEKKLDPVDPKEVKKDFKDRKDKDLDNDGDVDSSDEYLHKRRQAISKAMGKGKKDEVDTDPKLDEDVELDEKLDKEDLFHTSVENGKFMTHKHGGSGNQNTMYLHDLDHKGSDGNRPMLVTFAHTDKNKAENAAKKFGGKLFKTRFGTFRIIKEEVELDEAQKLFMFKTKAEADKKAKEVNGKVIPLTKQNFAVVVEDVELDETR